MLIMFLLERILRVRGFHFYFVYSWTVFIFAKSWGQAIITTEIKKIRSCMPSFKHIDVTPSALPRSPLKTQTHSPSTSRSPHPVCRCACWHECVRGAGGGLCSRRLYYLHTLRYVPVVLGFYSVQEVTSFLCWTAWDFRSCPFYPVARHCPEWEPLWEIMNLKTVRGHRNERRQKVARRSPRGLHHLL